MTINNIKKDAELITITEIAERMQSIDQQREKISSMKPPTSSLLYQKRHDKITKLTSRYDALWNKRAKLIR